MNLLPICQRFFLGRPALAISPERPAPSARLLYLSSSSDFSSRSHLCSCVSIVHLFLIKYIVFAGRNSQ